MPAELLEKQLRLDFKGERNVLLKAGFVISYLDWLDCTKCITDRLGVSLYERLELTPSGIFVVSVHMVMHPCYMVQNPVALMIKSLLVTADSITHMNSHANFF